jgi:hypothetical protein
MRDVMTVTVTATHRESAHPFATGKLVFGIDGTGRPPLIIRADPRIILYKQVISLMTGDPSFGVMLSDGMLRICGQDRSVLYRLGEYMPESRAYPAEWPDLIRLPGVLQHVRDRPLARPRRPPPVIAEQAHQHRAGRLGDQDQAETPAGHQPPPGQRADKPGGDEQDLR